MQTAENLVLGETQKGTAATYNERDGLVRHRHATREEGVTVSESINLDGNRVAGQVVGQYAEPPLPVGPAVLDEDAVTIGEALEATALSAGDKPVDQNDADAIQSAEMRATGSSEISPGGLAEIAQYAVSANALVALKTTLADVLEDATQKMVGDKPVTREDAKAIMSTTPGGIAESMAAAARLNQNI
ncbi:hypothetical protein M0R45_010803 [Rubus argutus]|uniref:SMP domain-containing protein n=1 Tax=Rubus argutus TaxID=59490 RepID=A0AAW1YAG4_RUBAR